MNRTVDNSACLGHESECNELQSVNTLLLIFYKPKFLLYTQNPKKSQQSHKDEIILEEIREVLTPLIS